MTLYSVVLFIHIVGALLLFAALTVEGLALRLLRRARTAELASAATSILALNRVIGPASAVAVLGAGLYLTVTSWGLTGWIAVSLLTWLLIAVFGAVNGLRMVGIERSLLDVANPTAGDLAARIHDPWAVRSWRVRVAMALGVVFLMTVKPGLAGALITLAVAAVAGVAMSVPALVGVRPRTPEGAR